MKAQESNVTLVQRLKHIYQTNQQMHIWKCVFVDNCHLQGYYVASSVKNARYLVTLKKRSSHLLRFGRFKTGICWFVCNARISNNENYVKSSVLKETSKIHFSFTNDINFTPEKRCNMRVSVSPFSSRVWTPLQRYVRSEHGKKNSVKMFFTFHVVE